MQWAAECNQALATLPHSPGSIFYCNPTEILKNSKAHHNSKPEIKMIGWKANETNQVTKAAASPLHFYLLITPVLFIV